MLVIRLIRVGKKNAPSYRVILIEKSAGPKSGKFLELLGNYNPRLINKKTGQKQLSLNGERIKHWLSHGAKASDTVHNLLVKQGIIKEPKIKKKIKVKKKEEKKEKPVKEEKKEESKDKEPEEKPKKKEEPKGKIIDNSKKEE